MAERQQYLTMRVRDYLNDGGKLLHAGETAQYEGLPGISDAVGGLYYASTATRRRSASITTSRLFDDCLILANDFRQYYLGAFTRTDFPRPAVGHRHRRPDRGLLREPRRPATTRSTRRARSSRPARCCRRTSSRSSRARARRSIPQAAGSPFAPIEGTRYAGALHADSSYMRLTKTITVPANATAQLQFQLSISTEAGYDHVIVEAHTPGQDNWTTLPDLNGGTQTAGPTECEPDRASCSSCTRSSRHYFGGAGCSGPGYHGPWNSFTGSTGGWDQVAFDLAAFTGAAGGPVEVSITYVTDPATGGVGAFVDDTRVVIGGTVTEADGFEGATSTWTPSPQPAGSPPNSGNWQIGERLLDFYAGTSTEDTLLLGFGLEHLSTDAERANLVRRALGGLLE